MVIPKSKELKSEAESVKRILKMGGEGAADKEKDASSYRVQQLKRMLRPRDIPHTTNHDFTESGTTKGASLCLNHIYIRRYLIISLSSYLSLIIYFTFWRE